ncbi:hypothetical protein ACFX2I_032460 [Malus domestica]
MVANNAHDFVEQMSFYSKTTSEVCIMECTVMDKIIFQEFLTSSLPVSINVYSTVGPVAMSHSLDDSTGL